MIPLSSWEAKRWNEKAGAGGKMQSVCWQSSGGSFGVCSPRQPVVPADTLHYPLESRATACREWQLPPAQVVALLEVGQLPGDPREKMYFWKDPGWIWSPNPLRLALGAGSTKGNRVWQNRWLAQTFFNKYKSYARASQMSCIRISHLPCPLVVCRKPEWWELSEGKGRGFSLQETNFSIYPSSAFTLKCFLCASGQRTRVALMLARTGMELQPDPLSIRNNIPALSRHIRNHGLTLNDTKLFLGSFVSSNHALC